VPLGKPGVLQDAEIQVCDAVSPQYVPTEVTQGSAGGGIPVRADRVPHLGIDAAQAKAGIGTIQRREWRAALERQKATGLPATQQLAGGAFLLPPKRKFIHTIHCQALRAIVAGAAAIGVPVERVLGHCYFT
jgi:hypothetical protein